MGRRELALIIGFVVAGVLVWQVTAPKAEGPGFSLGGWLAEVRREMRGRRASAEVTTSPSIPLRAETKELRITISGEVTIKGEDRNDVAAELKVVSNGYDDAEAKKLAEETRLKITHFADTVMVAWQFPDPGQQVPRLTLTVPSWMRVQIEGGGTARISNVDAVSLARVRGSTKIEKIGSMVKGDTRGGDLSIDGAEAIDLNLGPGETTLKDIRGDIRVNARGGEIRLDQARGRLTFVGNDARIRVDHAAGDVRVEAGEGDVELHDVSGALDIDAREASVTIGLARAVTAKIQVREGNLELTLPKEASTYGLEVRATGGELRVPDSLQKKTEGADTTVTKSGGANAPPIFVRGVGSTITIR